MSRSIFMADKKVDYEKLAKIAQSRGYKRNLSSREIGGLKKKALESRKK